MWNLTNETEKHRGKEREREIIKQTFNCREHTEGCMFSKLETKKLENKKRSLSFVFLGKMCFVNIQDCISFMCLFFLFNMPSSLYNRLFFIS